MIRPGLVRAFVLTASTALGVGLIWPLLAQQVPTFRTGIDVARVTVRVLDKNRKPIRDLTDKDFTVLLDGKPRPIVAFTTEDAAGPVAPTAPWMRDVAPDVAANNVENPRLVVIIIDDGLIPQDPWVLQKAKAIARTALDQLGPNDLASIVFTKDNREPRDFTADRSRLLTTIDLANYGFDRKQPMQMRYAILSSWRTMRKAVEYLKGVPELRSLIIYVTIGWPDPAGGLAPKLVGLGTDDLDDSETTLSLATEMFAGLGLAHAAGVPVYAVSPLGLIAPTPIGTADVSAPAANKMAEMLQTISASTGGHAIVAHNAPDKLVPTVFEENSLHYTLGYETPGPMADGRYRSLEVRVNRKDVIVEPGGERMFLSPKATPLTGATTTRALSGLVPLADEPLRLAVAAFADPQAPSTGSVPATVTLALGMDVPGSAAVGDEIEMELRVFDGEGRKQIDVKKQTMQVRPSPRDRSFDFLTTLALKPGRYNLRVSAHSTTRDKSGSVHTDITIPDYAKAPLTASDVVVSAALARTPSPLNAFDGLVPAIPTTAREFERSGRAQAFMRIYWGQNKPAVPVTMAATITNTDNTQVFERSTPLEPKATTSLRTADYNLDLPLANLAPGEYVLTLRAKPATGTELRRDVRFTVR